MRWPWTRPPETPSETLIARLETLEDRYKRLERRFDRLQGEFSAVTRDQYDNDDEDEEA